jgi:hypothetical protein
MWKEVPASVLHLGANVRLADHPFSDCTVKKIEEDGITLFRPYVHHEDWEYTGGCICYIGIEEFRIPCNESPILMHFDSQVGYEAFCDKHNLLYTGKKNRCSSCGKE